jgi:hypothetical protein
MRHAIKSYVTLEKAKCCFSHLIFDILSWHHFQSEKCVWSLKSVFAAKNNFSIFVTSKNRIITFAIKYRVLRKGTCHGLLCYAVQCCTVMCYAMLCYVMLCCAVLCCAVLCCAVLCCAVVYHYIILC